jgi:DNA-binding transcriptional regulator YiaG
MNRTALRAATLSQRLGKSQEQFAASYGISLDVLQNWEQQRR